MNPRTLDLMRRIVEPPKYTFWYRNRDSGTFDIGIALPLEAAQECRKDTIASDKSGQFDYSVIVPVGQPSPIFPPLAKRRHHLQSLAPVTTSCCLSWCKVPTAKHDAAKTERCLYYAIRKEAIDKRYAAFADRTPQDRGDNGETAWALEKTNAELEVLERQWRSLDPDRVRTGESP